MTKHRMPGPVPVRRTLSATVLLFCFVSVSPSAAQPAFKCDHLTISSVLDPDCLPKVEHHRLRDSNGDTNLGAQHSSHSRNMSNVEVKYMQLAPADGMLEVRRNVCYSCCNTQDRRLSSAQTDAEGKEDGPSLAVYLEEHTDMRGVDNQRWSRFVQWSGLFNSTEAASHPHLLDWFHHHDDVLLDQPTAFLNETNTTREWVSKDEEWFEIHQRHAQEMFQHKELDLILYGDSIFESILGTSIGHKIGRARGIPEVWSSYHSTSIRKVLSITGDTTVDLTWRLLNGAMPLHVTVKKVVVQTGANNILKQWFQIPEDFEPRTSAIAASIISVCDLVLAAWPDTELVLSGVLVGGVRGDWKGETRNWTLPNRYSESAAAINVILEDWVTAHEDDRVSYVDCSQLYIIDSNEVPGAFAIDANLLPDTLHPNRVGFKMLLDKCFEPALYGDGGAGAVQGLEPG